MNICSSLLSIFLLGISVILTAQSPQKICVVAMRIDTGKLDLSVESKARSEFQKKKNFELVTSPTNASLVFLALTEYDEYTAGTATPVSGAVISRTYLKGITGLVIPAEAYQQHKGDLEKLREAAIWQGSDSYSMMREASVVKLVKQFAEKK